MKTKIQKDGWNSIEIREGLNGSGHKRFILLADRTGEHKNIHVFETFETMGEALSWVEWAL